MSPCKLISRIRLDKNKKVTGKNEKLSPAISCSNETWKQGKKQLQKGHRGLLERDLEARVHGKAKKKLQMTTTKFYRFKRLLERDLEAKKGAVMQPNKNKNERIRKNMKISNMLEGFSSLLVLKSDSLVLLLIYL